MWEVTERPSKGVDITDSHCTKRYRYRTLQKSRFAQNTLLNLMVELEQLADTLCQDVLP
jgi:hypothetical protein